MSGEKNILSEFEAAVLIGMSPQLLRWLTKKSPKHGSEKKLKYLKKDKGVLFFDKDEVLSFDAWLKLPWPQSDKQTRPHIPSEIKEEIKREAGNECAICHSFRDSCEAAHIDPVSESKNNHPVNLIWLCSNHHRPYDKGLWGPKQKSKEEVLGFKSVLLSYQKTLWGVQAESIEKEFLILNELRLIANAITNTTDKNERKFTEEIAIKMLNELRDLSIDSKKNTTAHKIPKEVSDSKNYIALTSDKVTSKNLTEKLKYAEETRKKYITAKGFSICPLCSGDGSYEGESCPVCFGNQEVNEKIVSLIDTSIYQQVSCPLCKGRGSYDGNDCPECGGDKKMQRRFADLIDLSSYNKVSCPLCKGRGSYDGNDCPECGGNRKMERKYADQVDLSKYKKISCPLCKGRGSYEGNDCPECGGDKKIDKQYADQIDLSQYKKVKCPKCKGKGFIDDYDCPKCGGEREIKRRFL